MGDTDASFQARWGEPFWYRVSSAVVWRIAPILFLCFFAIPPFPARAQNAAPNAAHSLAPISVLDFRLPNGLRVLLAPDHSRPVVAVSLTDDVGSTSDPANREGLAHLVEHLTFESGPHFRNGAWRRALSDSGGTGNGETEIRAAFAGWRPSRIGQKLPPSTAFPPARERRVNRIDWPSEENTYLSIRALTAAPASADMPALYVANQILGATSAGRMFQNLREDRQLTYGSYTFFEEQRAASIWQANASVVNAAAPEAVAGILAGIHDLQRHPVGMNELTRAKSAFIGRLILQEQTPGMQMADVVTAMDNGLSPNAYRMLIPCIEAVTPADIQAVANLYLHDDGLQIIAIGPDREFAKDMAAFGTVDRYDAYGIKIFTRSAPATGTSSTP